MNCLLKVPQEFCSATALNNNSVCILQYIHHTLPKFSRDHYSKADCRLRGFSFASQYNGTVIGNLKAELNSVYPREFRYFA